MRSALLVLALLAALSLAACGEDSEDSEATTSASEEAGGTLFAQNAGSASLVPSGGGGDAYTLTLRDLPPTLTAFSDRPERRVETETVAGFVEQWEQRGFAEDPPNAAIVIDDESLSQDSVVAELSDPRYDADSGTLSYTAQLLEEAPSPALASAAESVDSSPPRRLGRVHLFIDDATGSTPHILVLSIHMSGTLQLDFDPGTTVVGVGGSGMSFNLGAERSITQVKIDVSRDAQSLSIGANATVDGEALLTVASPGATVSGTAQVPANAVIRAAIEGADLQQIQSGQFSLGG